MWSTDEDKIVTDKVINPIISKLSFNEIISNMPIQFKRLNLAHRRDCVTLFAICHEALRALSNQLKLGMRNRDPVAPKTAFEVIEGSTCRRVMLSFTDKYRNDADNIELKKSRHTHMLNCQTCLVTFSTIGYYNTDDVSFAIAVLDQIYDASIFGTWKHMKNGKSYFYTDDMVGADNFSDVLPGPCIKVMTGGNALQGRVIGKIYSLLQCVMVVNFEKVFKIKKAIDITKVHQDKLKLFHGVLSRYFQRVIWSDFDASNEYLKEVGAMVYEYFDIISNVAKVNPYFTVTLVQNPNYRIKL